MKARSADRTAFGQGQESVKICDDVDNPFASGTVEFRNFEVGRAFGIKHKAESPKIAFPPLKTAS